MNANRDLYETVNTDRPLIDLLSLTNRSMAVLLGLLAAAWLAVYALAQARLVGTPAWQLLAAAGITALVGLLQLPYRALVPRKPHLALWVLALTLGFWALSTVLLWEGVWPVAIVIAWLVPLLGWAGKARRAQLLGLAVLSAAFSVLSLWLNANPPFERLASSNSSGLAAIILLASGIALFAFGTILVRLISFRSLQNRLVTSFVLIITVPILVTTAFSAVTALTNSREQFGNSLQAISSLKQSQVQAIVERIAVEMSPLQQGSDTAISLVHILDRKDVSAEDYRLYESVASSELRDVINRYPSSQYEEVMLVDRAGNILLSTYQLDEGYSVARTNFFRQGAQAFYAEMARFPSKQNTANDYKLVAAAPFYRLSNDEVLGEIIVVADGDLIRSLLGPTVGVANAETYLVDSDYKLVDRAGSPDLAVSAWPIVHLILGGQGQSSESYTDYEGRASLGYMVWEPAIHAAIVSEIPASDVYNRALGTLFVSALVGLFSVIVAVIAALSTSGAITEPVQGLAKVAKALAAGNLSARAVIEQADEVGNLADSFNSMAAQLESIIGNLEQRVAERTEALEQQSLRLRTAAEVARDAASAPSLDDLLDQAARLIRDRFNLYHTGIFLLDEKREYAVLRASPSEAGKKMLANSHRLRVGEQGIVGRAAASGEPRIALDTGVDPVYFSNPLLPDTHSEMALPLKTSEGTIGVIDIQSDQPEAFTQDDIAIVQVMADQLATAIQRTFLLQQVQNQLNQLERTYQGFTEQSWKSFEQTGRQTVGYRFDNVRLESVQSLPEGADRSNGKRRAGSDGGAEQTLDVPIRLRGQAIGSVKLRFQSTNPPEATIVMVQQIADRLATALENARLLEDSVRRANKERAIGEITTKISSSVNMRNVLQTAVEELGRAIPGSDVLIQFRSDTQP